MKKSLLAIVMSVFVAMTATAQERKHCFTDEMYQESIRQNPEILKNRQALEEFTQQFIQNNDPILRNNRVVYIIPVVFHILHNYGPENISDAQVISCVRVMNEDFRLMNADTNLILPQFKGIAADCEIEFRLANLDPSGNCTNGIERIVTNLTHTANDASKLNPWPNNKYLNIWSAASLQNSGAAAYAYLPGGASSAVDGIMSLSNYIGDIGSSNPNNSRTLTHEIGHYLNLYHPWGPGNSVGTACGDDFVNDTPVTMGWSTCTLNGSVCNPPVVENVQNHMDYSYCTHMFTQGQKTRMQAALNSSVSGRNNLWKAANLTATGTDGSPITICAPNADFKANFQTVCSGSTVNFTDLSWNGTPTTWVWDFPGGVPSSSTDSNPSVYYANAGVYDVSLQVINSGGLGTITKSGYIRVSGGVTSTLPPYADDFETAASFPGDDGYVNNPDNGQTFTRVTNVGSSGTSCIRINNYNNVDGQTDEWISRTFDFSNLTFPVLTFKVANAQRNSTSNDELRLFFTSNCGQSWSSRWNKSGAALSTAGIVTSSFTPNSTQWRSESTSSLNSFALKPNVRFKFQNNSNRGNNTYIDDINITGTIVNVDEIQEVDRGFALYPNPSTGNSTIQFKISKSMHVKVEITDITGKSLALITDTDLSAGLHELPLSVSQPGIYMINLSVDGKRHVRRLVVVD